MKLIGITGKARTGKDTCAAFLVSRYGFKRVAFADPVRLAAQQVFGLTEDETWGDALKEVPIPYWGISPRQMFQKLGTEGVRNVFGPDTWVKRWEREYDSLSATRDVVVTDVRFDNEAKRIRAKGGIIVKLLREDAADVSRHSSENGISVLDCDVVITNDGTVEELHRKLAKLIK